MNINSTKNQRRLVILVLMAFVSFCIIYSFYRTNDLKKSGTTLSGRVLSDAFPSKSSVMEFKYEFYYKGQKHTDFSSAGVTNSSEFIGKIFPVRYSPKTQSSEILITPTHFKRYGLGFPDSLTWVKKYLVKGL